MRIIRLTPAVEKRLLTRRHERDAEAQRVASRIIEDVRLRGDVALAEWTKNLDGVDIRGGICISAQEIERGGNTADRRLRKAIEHAARNIRRVAERQLPREWTLEVEPGVSIRNAVRPIESVGCYVPGGRFSLLSTLLMTVVPAMVAGVKRIVVCSPKPNRELLAAAQVLGVKSLARIGGAQAIASLAYGTRAIARVDKIFGPGNRYVTAAKQLVSHDCAIDLPAGPTEALVLANSGNPRWIAADLLAQAEHAPDAGSFLVTASRALALATQAEVGKQLTSLPKSNPAWSSTRNSGAILLAPSMAVGREFVNRFAPEHLNISAARSDELLKKVYAAGTIFVGPWSAQPFGDYATGSNHVLPTGGWARARGGLSTADFVKCFTVQTVDRRGFSRLADDVQVLAKAEGLLAHGNAIEVRR